MEKRCDSSGRRAKSVFIEDPAIVYLQFLYELVVKNLQVVHRRFLGGPTDDEALSVTGDRLGDDVEVDVVDLLVGNATVILDEQPSISQSAGMNTVGMQTCRRL